MSEGERSLSSGRKARRSCSPSRSSSNHRHSSTQRRYRSSASLRDSRSFSRSFTYSRSRSRGRFRSYSHSRSHSRSRSQSMSRSRSPSYSRSRSRSRSRYRSRSLSRSRKRHLSRSPRKRKPSKSKPDVVVHGTEKTNESKVFPVSRHPAVPVPESVPVIPLSDSPPPSRWKPGQKPWKPSYIHIQEIKAKVAPSALASIGQAADSGTEAAQASVTAKSLPGKTESDKSCKPARHSCSRSSRSRSYSRSYSRSRSRSYSRSRSRSPHVKHSRSSSYSRSESEDSQKTGSNKRDSLEKEWKEYYCSLDRVKNLDQCFSLSSSKGAHSGSENRTGSVHSPNISFSQRSGSSEKKRGSSQDQEVKHHSSVKGDNFTSKSEWDSDSDKVNQIDSAMPSKMEKQAIQSREDEKSSVTGWNSESDSENVTARTVAMSDKEEGEASSESDFDVCRKTSEAVTALGLKIASAIASDQPVGNPEKATESVKQKTKKAKRKRKRKRRSEKKTSSHHSKDKGKRSKRKHQKLKETFHWQPPLEFGDEEDEDESKKDKHSPGSVVIEMTGVDSMKKKDQNVDSSNNYPAKEGDRGQRRAKECINKTPSNTEPLSTKKSGASGPQLSSVKEQESLDDMDICTPEHDTDVAEPPVTHDSHRNNSKLTLKLKSPDMSSKEPALPHAKEQIDSTSAADGLQDEAAADKPTGTVINFKWRPLKGTSSQQNVNLLPITAKNIQNQENPSKQGVRMEIKSKNRVRPGSLFDEVRKTVRLNQRQRNQESSSEERSPSVGKPRAMSRSPNKSRSGSRKSGSASSHCTHARGWSPSSSRSRSRSHSSYTSRHVKSVRTLSVKPSKCRTSLFDISAGGSFF